MKVVFFLRNVFLSMLIPCLLISSTGAMVNDVLQQPKSAIRPIRGIHLDSQDFFYLSFTPTFDFFSMDDKAHRFLKTINPPRVRQELEGLMQMSQVLSMQMPALAAQIKDTLEKSQIAAFDKVFQTCPSDLIESSFLLTPLSENHLKTFRAGQNNRGFNHPQIDERIDKTLKKVMSFGFLPFEREIIFSQQEIPVLHVLGLDRFFDIEDHFSDIRYCNAPDGNKHAFISRCHEPSGSDGKFLEHISANSGVCWCLNFNRQQCYSKAMSKIHSILYGNIQCKKLADWDEDDKRFWTGKRELVSVFDNIPYYKRTERSKGDDKSLSLNLVVLEKYIMRQKKHIRISRIQ